VVECRIGIVDLDTTGGIDMQVSVLEQLVATEEAGS
jgi:hypothetical protein